MGPLGKFYRDGPVPRPAEENLDFDNVRPPVRAAPRACWGFGQHRRAGLPLLVVRHRCRTGAAEVTAPTPTELSWAPPRSGGDTVP